MNDNDTNFSFSKDEGGEGRELSEIVSADAVSDPSKEETGNFSKNPDDALLGGGDGKPLGNPSSAKGGQVSNPSKEETGNFSKNPGDALLGGGDGKPSGNPSSAKGGQVRTEENLTTTIEPVVSTKDTDTNSGSIEGDSSNSQSDVRPKRLRSKRVGRPSKKKRMKLLKRKQRLLEEQMSENLLGTMNRPTDLPTTDLTVSSSGEVPGSTGVKRSAGISFDVNVVTKKPKLEIMAARITDPPTKVIIEEGYPGVELTTEDLANLNNEIEAEICKMTFGEFPTFSDSFVMLGAIVVVAENDYSMAWLESVIPRLVPWQGAKLAVVGMDVLRMKPHRATIWIPGNRNEPELILRMLEQRHSDLGINIWHLWPPETSEGPDCGTFLQLTIPEQSVEALRKRNFQLIWGLGKIDVKVDEASQEQIR